MRKSTVIVLVLTAVVVVWVRVSANQGQRVPGPGSGVVTVEGTVDIGNTPTVNASQAGAWKMSVANVPDVRVVNTATVALAPPDFIKTGRRYAITWSSSEREVVAVSQVTAGGWVRVQGSVQPRWINLSLARAVEDVP
jgi:hypothetical protein